MATIVQMPLRLQHELATKVRMISAANNVPMNAYIATVLAEHVADWEARHGGLPMLPPKGEEDTE